MTSSPAANPVTPWPARATTPARSLPCPEGNVAGQRECSRPSRILASPGLMPAALTRTSTWPGPGSGIGTSATLRTSTPPYSWNRTAFGMAPSVLPGGGPPPPGTGNHRPGLVMPCHMSGAAGLVACRPAFDGVFPVGIPSGGVGSGHGEHAVGVAGRVGVEPDQVTRGVDAGGDGGHAGHVDRGELAGGLVQLVGVGVAPGVVVEPGRDAGVVDAEELVDRPLHVRGVGVVVGGEDAVPFDEAVVGAAGGDPEPGAVAEVVQAGDLGLRRAGEVLVDVAGRGVGRAEQVALVR